MEDAAQADLEVAEKDVGPMELRQIDGVLADCDDRLVAARR